MANLSATARCTWPLALGSLALGFATLSIGYTDASNPTAGMNFKLRFGEHAG